VTAETAVEYLGAHEYYYWGWGEKLLAKLSDGVSFKFFRVASDFDTVAASGSPTDVEKIEQKQTNLFQNAYKTIVPPVFVQDVAVFFIVDKDNNGYLKFYQWNTIANFFELKQTTQAPSGTTENSDWQTKTSLIRTLDGVILKQAGIATLTYYETLTYTWASSTVTVDWATMASYTGTVDLANLILRQRRDSWETYSTTETDVPNIVGWMNNDYVFQFTYAASVLTASNSIAIPCNTNQPLSIVNADNANLAADLGCTFRTYITVQPEWFDVGVNYIAMLSPVNCQAVTDTTAITNAAVYYYKLDTVWDIDDNQNGIVDSTENPLDLPNEVAVDYTKGWTCNDMPTSFNWQQVTTATWTGNWL
jgi:hypothetical protein